MKEESEEVDAEVGGQKFRTRNVRIADIVLAVIVLYAVVWKPWYDDQRKECPAVEARK